MPPAPSQSSIKADGLIQQSVGQANLTLQASPKDFNDFLAVRNTQLAALGLDGKLELVDGEVKFVPSQHVPQQQQQQVPAETVAAEVAARSDEHAAALKQQQDQQIQQTQQQQQQMTRPPEASTPTVAPAAAPSMVVADVQQSVQHVCSNEILFVGDCDHYSLSVIAISEQLLKIGNYGHMGFEDSVTSPLDKNLPTLYDSDNRGTQFFNFDIRDREDRIDNPGIKLRRKAYAEAIAAISSSVYDGKSIAELEAQNRLMHAKLEVIDTTKAQANAVFDSRTSSLTHSEMAFNIVEKWEAIRATDPNARMLVQVGAAHLEGDISLENKVKNLLAERGYTPSIGVIDVIPVNDINTSFTALSTNPEKHARQRSVLFVPDQYTKLNPERSSIHQFNVQGLDPAKLITPNFNVPQQQQQQQAPAATVAEEVATRSNAQAEALQGQRQQQIESMQQQQIEMQNRMPRPPEAATATVAPDPAETATTNSVPTPANQGATRTVTTPSQRHDTKGITLKYNVDRTVHLNFDGTKFSQESVAKYLDDNKLGAENFKITTRYDSNDKLVVTVKARTENFVAHDQLLTHSATTLPPKQWEVPAHVHDVLAERAANAPARTAASTPATYTTNSVSEPHKLTPQTFTQSTRGVSLNFDGTNASIGDVQQYLYNNRLNPTQYNVTQNPSTNVISVSAKSGITDASGNNTAHDKLLTHVAKTVPPENLQVSSYLRENLAARAERAGVATQTAAPAPAPAAAAVDTPPAPEAHATTAAATHTPNAEKPPALHIPVAPHPAAAHPQGAPNVNPAAHGGAPSHTAVSSHTRGGGLLTGVISLAQAASTLTTQGAKGAPLDAASVIETTNTALDAVESTAEIAGKFVKGAKSSAVLGTAGKLAGKLTGGAAIVAGVYTTGHGIVTGNKDEVIEGSFGAAGAYAGAAVGASWGASIGGTVGSIIPGAGTVAGAAVGGAAGALIGGIAGSELGQAAGHAIVAGAETQAQVLKEVASNVINSEIGQKIIKSDVGKAAIANATTFANGATAVASTVVAGATDLASNVAAGASKAAQNVEAFAKSDAGQAIYQFSGAEALTNTAQAAVTMVNSAPVQAAIADATAKAAAVGTQIADTAASVAKGAVDVTNQITTTVANSAVVQATTSKMNAFAQNQTVQMAFATASAAGTAVSEKAAEVQKAASNAWNASTQFAMEQKDYWVGNDSTLKAALDKQGIAAKTLATVDADHNGSVSATEARNHLVANGTAAEEVKSMTATALGNKLGSMLSADTMAAAKAAGLLATASGTNSATQVDPQNMPSAPVIASVKPTAQQSAGRT